MPSPGTITRLRIPAGPGVRWDGGYHEGDAISQYYDNLIGKLIVWAPDRDRAIERMLRALDEFEIEGVRTTIPAHKVLLATTTSAPRATRRSGSKTKSTRRVRGARRRAAPKRPPPTARPSREPLVERTVPVEVDGRRFSVRVWLPEAPAPSAAPAGRARPKRVATSSGSAGGDGTVSAPMQGTIVQVLVEVGATVEVGQAILVLEAMKMENQISAERAGTVTEIRVAAGDSVGTGDVLAVIE